MPLPEKTCADCGKRFVLLPNKPGLANICPQCSVPPVEIAVVERKPRKKRQKTPNELLGDAERKLRRHKKLTEIIYGRTKDSDR
jgi:DNA-directed RNA polymerase subunit RPC12/RpoP